MEKQNVRVVVASESPGVRSLLSQIVERENDADIVGQAPNARKALTLTRELRPNIVLLDSYLPYSTSLEAVPLSRISGLDVAQTITEEIPKTKVILLNNLDDGAGPAALAAGKSAGYCVSVGGKCVSITRWPENDGQSELVFASIAAKEGDVPEKTATALDKLVFFGALGFAGGFGMTLTIILAPVGVAVMGIGALATISGLAGKLAAFAWKKMRNNHIR